MIDLSKKTSNKKNSNKKIDIKNPFSDMKNISDPLEISSSLSSSLSDIEKITNQAKKFKSRFLKFVCLIFFLLLLYVIYKIYVSFIKKKTLTVSDLNIEKDIQELLDNFK